MKDIFGNYVIQKCLEYGPKAHVQALFDEVKGNILEMTKHIYGCRVVQKFIEVLDLEGQKEILSELENSILECIYDLYGNHVVQKIIEKLPYQEIGFIQKHVEENWKDLCLHTYGCRVIQRILENCPKSCTDPIYDNIINNLVSELSQDQFGNYVIQLVLEKGTRSEDKKAICHSLLGDARMLSIHKYASNVVEKCIEHWEKEDKALIIHELLGDKSTKGDQSENLSLYKMMDNKYGNYVVQKAIEEADSEQRAMFYSKIKGSEYIDQNSSNYVKHVINCLDRLSLPKAQPEGSVNAGSIHITQQ